MKHLKLRYKFLLIMALLSIPTAVATVLLANVANRSINFAEKEILGAEFIHPMAELQQLLETYHLNLIRDSGTSPTVSRNQIQEKIQEVQTMTDHLGDPFNSEITWPPLKTAVESLLEHSPQADSAQLNETYHSLALALETHLQQIGDQSNLILDPDLDSYYLMDTLLLRLLPLLQNIHHFQILASDTQGNQHRQDLQFMVQSLNIMALATDNAIQTAVRNNAALAPAVNAPTIEFMQSIMNALDLATAELNTAENIQLHSSIEKLLTTSVLGYQLDETINQELRKLLELRISGDMANRNTMLSMVMAAVLLGLFFTYFVGFRITRAIQQAQIIATAISEDRLDTNIGSSARDEPGQLLSALAIMQENLKARITEERKLLIHNGRMKQALESVSSVVLVGNIKGKIIYCNNSANQYFKTYEKQIAQDLPGFSLDTLLGQSIELFCKTPPDLTSTGTSTPHTSNQNMGGRSVIITTSAVYDEQQRPLGTVIELYDRTDKLSIENAVTEDVHHLVQGALIGQLSTRIDATGKPDFLVPVYNGINEMLDVCGLVISSTGQLFKRMAEGDFSKSMEIPMGTELKGEYAQLRQDADTTINKLTGIISRIQADAAVISGSTSKVVGVNAKLEDEAMSSSERASDVSTGVASITENVDTIAGAAEEMNASIKEIAKNTERGTRVAGEAVSLTKSADTSVTQLARSSEAIGDMIKVINSIAEQTNLLALNATIEAARAGEAGKGFAVVANEVKELAKETAKATEDISEKISTIQLDSNSAADRIRAIDKIVEQINELQLGTVSAMSQQTSTTQEISRSISSVATSSLEMSGQLTDLVSGTNDTQNAVGLMKQELLLLNEIAGNMRSLTEHFKLAETTTK